MEGINAKSTAMYNLVKDFKSKGIPIHGVGLQAHFELGKVPSSSNMQENIERFAALGLEVTITELDVRMHLPADAHKLSVQADNHKAVVKACRAVPKCVGVVVWGFTDKYSWIPSAFPGMGWALLWTDTYQKKPAYASVHDALGP